MALIPPPWGGKTWVPSEPDGKFKPGQSGNPAGRPPGAKSKRTLVAELLETGATDIAQAMLTAAKNGDVAAAKLCLERIVPPLRNEGPRVKFDLDPTKPLGEQGQQVFVAMAAGEMDVGTCKLLVECLSAIGGLNERDQLAERLAALEAEVREGKQTGAPGSVLQTGEPS